jgi:hypothetical protein
MRAERTGAGSVTNAAGEIWQLVDSSGIGGIETHMRVLTQALNAAGYRARILLLAPHGANPWLDQLRAAGVPFEVLDGRFSTLLACLRSARPAALAALGVIDDANGIDALQSLLASPSAETRYGAFRALWRLDRSLPLVRGERLGEACGLHVLDVEGPPLVHATRSFRPEIVFFGTSHPLADGLRAEAGSSIVVVVDGGTAEVSRFVAGQPDRFTTVKATADAVIRAIVEVGGTYPDTVQFLQQASASRALASRLAFDAVPSEFDGRQSIPEEASRQAREVSDDDDATASSGDRKRADGSS